MRRLKTGDPELTENQEGEGAGAGGGVGGGMGLGSAVQTRWGKVHAPAGEVSSSESESLQT